MSADAAPTHSGPASGRPPEELEDLLAECLRAAESGGPDAAETLIAAHPEAAAELRRWLGRARSLGLVGAGHDVPFRLPAEAGGSLGGCRLLRVLGEGAMGVVWLAEDPALGRQVAIKVIRAGPLASASAVARFRREAQTAGRLKHPNIATVHGAGEEHGVLYIAMEYVPGRGFDEVLREASTAGRRLPVREIVRTGLDVARALECAHEAGVVHRDVKPSNIRVAADGRAVLLDFGLARDLDQASLSLAGGFVGSPCYAAPEQVRGDTDSIGPATDVYGLGATLYEAATGGPPFAAGSADAVFRRILEAEPAPPRRRNPELPRDLECVVLKAIEKDPRRRYASARDLREELEALLDLRPVKARPAGWFRRARVRCRSHRTATGALLAVLATGLAVAGWRIVEYRRAAEHTEQEIDAALGAAAAEIRTYRDLRKELETEEAAAALLRGSIGSRWFEPDELRQLTGREDRVRAARLGRERAVAEVLRLLGDVERRRPGHPRVPWLRAQLHLERLREAETVRDARAAALFREQIRLDDPSGETLDSHAPRCRVNVESDPPGAEVHLFAYADLADLVPGGEHRIVPVPPAGREGQPPPGAWALRVVRASGGLLADDLIVALAGAPIEDSLFVVEGRGDVEPFDRLVEIDGRPVRDAWDLEPREGTAPVPPAERTGPRRFGFDRGGRRFEVAGESLLALGIAVAGPEAAARRGGAAARVWRDGAMIDAVLPAGAEVRITTQPLFTGPPTRFGVTPVRDRRVEAGAWLLVFRREGRETLRVPLFATGPAAPPLRVPLPDADSGPEGFVPIPAGDGFGPHWIMEREVTCGEYLAFLNDPATLAAIDAAPEPVRFPRDEGNRSKGGEWPRGPDGRFALAAGWLPEFPVIGVSWDDAVAYAAWLDGRSGASPGFRIGLPTAAEWKWAATAGHRREFVHGDVFHPHWIKSCFARPRVCLEPVRSFPRDESPFGVRDLAGSASEWLDGWYWEASGLRGMAAGSWAHGEPKTFTIECAQGGSQSFANGVTGFRLVARPR